MKYITVILIFLSINCNAYSQESIQKKTNTIIIYDTIPGHNIWSELTGILVENGYGILSADKETGTVTTTERAFESGSLKINILVRDNRITMRGDYRTDLSVTMYGVTSSSTWTQITYAGQRNSINMSAWNEFYKLSQQIPGTREYLVK
jgi:hypothetical protein